MLNVHWVYNTEPWETFSTVREGLNGGIDGTAALMGEPCVFP